VQLYLNLGLCLAANKINSSGDWDTNYKEKSFKKQSKTAINKLVADSSVLLHCFLDAVLIF